MSARNGTKTINTHCQTSGNSNFKKGQSVRIVLQNIPKLTNIINIKKITILMLCQRR